MPSEMDNNNVQNYGLFLGLGIAATGLLAAGIVIAARFKVAKPNQILAVTGLGTLKQHNGIKLTTNAFIWPIVQNVESIDLSARQLDFFVEATSKDMLKISSKLSVTVKPNYNDPEALRRYARTLSYKGDNALAMLIQEQSTGAFRTTMAHMNALDVFQGRAELVKRVSSEHNRWVDDLGLEVVALSITNIGDPTPSERGLQGYFKILEEAKLTEAHAESVLRQSAAQITEAQATSNRDIQIADLRRAASVAEVSNAAAVSLKQQEVTKAVESARKETQTEKQRADVLPSAIAAREAAIENAEAKKQAMIIEADGKLYASKQAAESYHQMVQQNNKNPEAAMQMYLHQTGKYTELAEIFSNGMKNMKPSVHVIQNGGAASDSTNPLAQTVNNLYTAAIPPVLQANQLFRLGLFNTRLPKSEDTKSEDNSEDISIASSLKK
jgi:regulator of protease activity HflC (stomatin/prohibitin superfamily)